MGVTAGVALSALTLVRAAVPASDGTIHGCRNTTTTLLRVIDSDNQSCDSNETGLNWDQKGVRAYARLVYDNGTFAVDSSRSYNVSNLHVLNVHPAYKNLCFTVQGTPKSVSVTPETDFTTSPQFAAFKDGNGWTNTTMGAACDQEDSTTNVFVRGYSSAPFYITVY